MHQRIQRALAAQRRGQGGFTMVELAIVLVIAGIILVAALKGTDMINKAKIERVVNDIKGLQGMAFEHEKRTGRLPGDCNGDGIIGVVLSNSPANVVRLTGTTYTDDPNPVATTGGACSGASTGPGVGIVETEINTPWSDLRKANLVDPNRVNRQLAKNQTNNWYAFGSLTSALGSKSTNNFIVVYDIPLWMAKGIDVAIDGPDPLTLGTGTQDGGQVGRVRLFHDGNAIHIDGAAWPNTNNNDDQLVAVSFQFDRAIPSN